MTVDARLLEQLEKRLGLGRRQVDRRISERARTLVLPREQAAMALALEEGVSVTRFATDDDLAAIRGAAGAHPPTPVAPAASAPKRAAAKKATAKRRTTRRRTRGKTVFVVHGRDEQLRRSIFSFLRALGLQPIEWSKAVKATKKGAPYVGQVLDNAFKEAAAVVVLLTPDDQARLKKSLAKKTDPKWEMSLRGQARPNVLFEAGMAFGTHEDSTILVQVGDLRPFSDVGGRHVIHLHDGVEARQQLAERLDAAGCDIDTSGTDWFSEGSFGKP